jgi:endoglucanase
MKTRLAVLLSIAGLAIAPSAANAAGNFANAGVPGASTTNPLAGIPWGTYTGPINGLWDDWHSSHGKNKALLAKEALQPLMYWFGAWNSDGLAESTAQNYIQDVQDGNPNKLVQMAIFRLVPWEKAACNTLPSAQNIASYRNWIVNWAAGIGNARVAMDLQPDLPFEFCVPGHNQYPEEQVSYAAQIFSALPHTTVYIDAGASDWQSVSDIVSMLRESGVQYTRGFALGATHYSSIGDEIRYGQQVVRALAADGIPGMHFIIDTAQNGKPFTTQKYHSEFLAQTVCASKTSEHCVTLGVPPTYKVAANPKLYGITAHQASVAAQLCDGYLWFGRPWLNDQNAPFEPARALGLAATTPYQ